MRLVSLHLQHRSLSASVGFLAYLLCILNKVWVIYVRLPDHINTNCILVNEQYGFRTQSSTEQATFSLINNILTAMNNNLKIGGTFCDLQKAFDCMDHKILMNKLEFYGIQGKFKTLNASYIRK